MGKSKGEEEMSKISHVNYYTEIESLKSSYLLFKMEKMTSLN